MNGKITLPEAARMLGVSRDVAMRLLTTRVLDGELVGGRWLLERTSVERERERRGEPVAATA
jgi:excisionase family DNA binding protein